MAPAAVWELWGWSVNALKPIHINTLLSCTPYTTGFTGCAGCTACTSDMVTLRTLFTFVHP